MSAKIEHAKILAGRGFHVFGIVEGEKRPPRRAGWQNRATRDPDKLRREWDKYTNDNIGISTSKFGDNEALLIVDVDTKDGRDGEASLRELEAKHGPLPNTFTQRTPTGGWHLVYRVASAVRQGANVFGPGLDVRSQGGYIVGAGSTVAQGDYVVERDLPIAEAPQWLVNLCGKSAAPAAPTGESVVAPSADARAVRYLASLPPVEQGERNVEGFKVAAQLKDFGLDATNCELAMIEYWKCEPALELEELRTLIASAYKRGGQGSNAPEQDFDVYQGPAPASRAGSGKSILPAEFVTLGVQALRARPASRPFVIAGWLPCAAGALVGPGGTAKSTLLLHMAAHIILGRDWLGHEILRPGPVLVFSGEDDAGLLRERMFCIANPLGLDATDQESLGANLHIADVTERTVRLVDVDQSGNLFITQLVAEVVAKYEHVRPSTIIFDSANMFGPGERYVNDWEALLMVAGRRIAQRLHCAVIFVHHVAKAVARHGLVDQHAARGGSAFADNSRFQWQLVIHKGEADSDFRPPASVTRHEIAAEEALRLHCTKLSWARRPVDPIWITRHAFDFRLAVGAPTTKEEQADRELGQDVRQLVRFIEARLTGPEPAYVNKTKLRDMTRAIGLPERRLRPALAEAESRGLLKSRDLPADLKQGSRTTYLQPAADWEARFAKAYVEASTADAVDVFEGSGERPFPESES